MTSGICKRKDGRFCSTLQVDGKRRFIYGQTAREAREKLDELRQQAGILDRLPDNTRRTVGDLLDAWLKITGTTLRPKTLHDYRQMCTYIRAGIGTLKLNRLEPVYIQRFYSTLPGKRVPSRVHAVLHRALTMAVLWQWLSDNPANRIIKPTYHPPRKSMWTSEQLQQFLQGAQGHRMFALWLTALSTGCRLGELLGLRWVDIDWTAGALHMKRNRQWIGGRQVEGPPKTRAGERRIALPAWLLEVLRRQRGEEEEDVFPCRPAAVEHALSRECARLHLPPLTPHGLRHLHASLLLGAGLDIPAVSARLGHANPSITMKVYAHALAGADERAAAAISIALGCDNRAQDTLRAGTALGAMYPAVLVDGEAAVPVGRMHGAKQDNGPHNSEQDQAEEVRKDKQKG